MSDRGLPVVEGAQACPFVAFEEDRDERATSPDHRHRCYAVPRPEPRALAHQEAYCLSSAFPVCPIFQDWARREAAQARTAGGVEPSRRDDAPQRNPPRDWSAPPPWAAGAGGVAGAAAAGAGGVGVFGDEPEDGEAGSEAPGFLASRSAAAGGGLAGSAADRLAGPADDGGADPGLAAAARDNERRPSWRAIVEEPDDDRYDDSPEPFADGLEEDDLEEGPRGRPRSARASGGISFGRDRRPRVGATRRAHGWDDSGPSWERPRHNEPYPALKGPMGLPRVSRLGAMAIALVLAAIALFFLPQLLGFGNRPQSGGGGTSAPSGSVGPSTSVEPTPIPPPTPQIYIVKAGDTMSRIATMFGVGLDELIAANRELHPNPDTLQIGDEVIIPTTPPDELGGSPELSPAP